MRWLREPLVHFLALGALLFGATALLHRAPPEDPVAAPERIVVSAGLRENFVLNFARNNGRAPTDAELAVAIEEYVREEVLCREARALGLDRDDPAVRRRLRQRMEFAAEDAAGAAAPTEAELAAFLRENPARFRAAPDAPAPELAAVRDAVENAWLAARRQRALDAAYRELRARYNVEIAPAPTAAPAP